jgi:hypothetical protein
MYTLESMMFDNSRDNNTTLRTVDPMYTLDADVDESADHLADDSDWTARSIDALERAMVNRAMRIKPTCQKKGERWEVKQYRADDCPMCHGTKVRVSDCRMTNTASGKRAGILAYCDHKHIVCIDVYETPAEAREREMYFAQMETVCS